MLTRAQQYALSRGIAAESAIAADETLARLDPLVRSAVRRRIRKLLRRVELETASTEVAHRLRLAYLYGARQTVADPEDTFSVAEAAAALPAPSSVGRTGPWLVAALSAFMLVLGGAGLWLRHALRPFVPLETPAGNLLGDKLADHVVALSRHDAAGAQASREALTNVAATTALGADGVQRINGVLSSMQAFYAPAPDPEPRPRIEAFQNAVTGLDHVLQTRALPYFVDAEIRFAPDAQPLPMSYYVQRETLARVEGKQHRVVRLWRLDTLGVAQAMLGFTRPHTPAAIVLLDQVESDLIRFTLPAAAPQGSVELTDDETREKSEPWVVELEERATKAMGAHYRSLGGALASDAIRIGTLLSRRRNLVRKWAALLRGQGMELVVPAQLFPEVDYAKELELRIPRADLDDWNDLHDELRTRLPGFEALRDRFVQGVERHEVQHRLDYARGLIPVPAFLCDVLGLESPLDAAYGSLAARSRDEASAYLAEVARPGDSPLLDVIILAHFMLDRRQLGSPYSYAALEVYAALGKALGINVEALLGRSISRERFARLAEAVWEHPPAELRDAARRAYASDFGAPLPEVSFAAARDNAYYRPDRAR
jgi:hypothetical protein